MTEITTSLHFLLFDPDPDPDPAGPLSSPPSDPRVHVKTCPPLGPASAPSTPNAQQQPGTGQQQQADVQQQPDIEHPKTPETTRELSQQSQQNKDPRLGHSGHPATPDHRDDQRRLHRAIPHEG